VSAVATGHVDDHAVDERGHGCLRYRASRGAAPALTAGAQVIGA